MYVKRGQNDPDAEGGEGRWDGPCNAQQARPDKSRSLMKSEMRAYETEGLKGYFQKQNRLGK